MTRFSSAARPFAGALLSLALLGASINAWADPAPAGSASPDGTTADKSTTPEATALAGGGFALDFRIWQPPVHGAAKSLSVTYTWGKGGARTVAAQRQNDRWHVEFPDQPQANEQASLKLHYAFALSKEDQASIDKAARNMAQALLDAAVSAAQESHPATPADAGGTAGTGDAGATGSTAANGSADGNKTGSAAAGSPATDGKSPAPEFATAFAAASKPIAASEDANTLRRYGTSAGQDGLTVVLKQLGVTVSADDGSYGLAPEGGLQGAANGLRVRHADAGSPKIAQDFAAATPEASEQPCVAAVGQGTLDEVRAAQALSACANTLDAVAAKLAPPLDKTHLDSVHGLKEAAQKPAPDLKVIGAFITDLASEPKLKNSYSRLALRLARLTLLNAETNKGQAATVQSLVSNVDSAFEDGARIEDGSTLIEASAQPRRYDVATGVVFVSGLQDIVVPTLISICPAEGCLKANDVAWRAKHGWWRAVSFDAGVRVKTLDTQDRRQSDKLSFLTGISCNPVSVLRVSGGFYWFENAQTNNWTGQPYVGVTLNVLNAAEILGSLGLGDKLGPTPQPIQ